MANRFDSYMFAIGSRHPAIKVVKQFLNAHHRVSQFNLPLTDEFNSQTSAALAEYQQYKILRDRRGVMNGETYSAMGRDMGAVRIKMATIFDPTLAALLTANSNPNSIDRALPTGEVTLAKTLYRDSLKYENVRIHNYKYFDLPFGISQPDTTLMTPNGEIYAPPAVYSKDFSGESNERKSTFIHEMCHVWQWQRNIKNVKWEAIKEKFAHGSSYDEEAYKYKIELYYDLKQFGLEQQATMIEDYYRVQICGMDFAQYRGQYRIQNDVSTPKAKDHARRILFHVLSTFLIKPEYLGENP